MALSSCAQQTTEAFGEVLGRDAVLKDAGWAHKMSEHSPFPDERRNNVSKLSIASKELKFRKLDDDKTCAWNMEKGATDTMYLNTERKQENQTPAEQNVREARAASY